MGRGILTRPNHITTLWNVNSVTFSDICECTRAVYVLFSLWMTICNVSTFMRENRSFHLAYSVY